VDFGGVLGGLSWAFVFLPQAAHDVDCVGRVDLGLVALCG
jgi:hypothetical protein